MKVRALVRRFYRELMPLLYGRTNYKLFLKRSFESLDARHAAVVCATNVLPGVIRPVPITAPFGRSMLVVAPHQDDEVIGCGGCMVLQTRAGADLHVVFTQDGGNEHVADGRTREEQIAVREAEACRVTEELGIPAPRFLRFEKMFADEHDALADALFDEIERTRADVVFAPFFLDYNFEHQLTNYALAEALDRCTRRVKVMGYEVWGLTVPNVIVKIDEVHAEKRRLIEFYESQLSGKDYAHGIMGLNMFHSLHFGAGECAYAERFFEMPSPEYVRAVRAVRETVGEARAGVPRAF